MLFLSCESKAIETFDKINWQDPLVYETFGDIKIKSGDVDDVYHFYQKGLLIAEANNERRSSASLYNKIAMFYEGLKKPDSAIYYAKKGLEVSDSIFRVLAD